MRSRERLFRVIVVVGAAGSTVTAEPWFLEHGCAGRAVANAAFDAGVRELVLPGMAHVGVDPEPAAAWLRTRA